MGVGAAIPFAVGGLEGGRGVAEVGARLADMDGDGDERDTVTPLVWMPGGMGRLIFVGAGDAVAAMTLAVGAMLGKATGRGVKYGRRSGRCPERVASALGRVHLGRGAVWWRATAGGERDIHDGKGSRQVEGAVGKAGRRCCCCCRRGSDARMDRGTPRPGVGVVRQQGPATLCALCFFSPRFAEDGCDE